VTGAERGSATIWVLACCALVMLVGFLGVARTQAVLARHRAGAAADLAALAGAGRIGVGGDVTQHGSVTTGASKPPFCTRLIAALAGAAVSAHVASAAADNSIAFIVSPFL